MDFSMKNAIKHTTKTEPKKLPEQNPKEKKNIMDLTKNG
jgi:hypothetical protein